MPDSDNFEDESFDVDELSGKSGGEQFIFLHDGTRSQTHLI